MITARGIFKSYQSFKAVQDLNLEVPAGKVFGFLGPNGAGKTTTIRMLTGILEPDEGSIEVFGKDFSRHRNEILNDMGFIPDRPFLYGKLTIMELLHFLGSLRRLDKSYVQKRGMELLEQFNLGEFANQLVERLSHGMRQKVVFSSALLHEPKLLIIDEPMVGLDPRAARQVKELLRGYVTNGRTVFMSTHTLEVAASLCDRVGIIHKGQMVANETLETLTQRLEKNDGDLEAVFLALTEDSGDEAVPQ